MVLPTMSYAPPSSIWTKARKHNVNLVIFVVSSRVHAHDHSPCVCYDFDLDVLMLQRFQPDLVGHDTLVFFCLPQALQRYTRFHRAKISAMEGGSGEHGHELGIPAWFFAEVFINISMGNFMRHHGSQNIRCQKAARDCIPMVRDVAHLQVRRQHNHRSLHFEGRSWLCPCSRGLPCIWD